jgi:hypothetical protein
MTTCSVSAERHCTTLHVSLNGLDYELKGIVLDHQNKDMILFEGKVGGRFMALTRPLGEVYFAYPEASPYAGGPSINLAQSPDAMHWKPLDQPGIRVRKGSTSSMKVGGGSQPIRTARGWFLLYHGVETREAMGIYRTFWALLDLDDPSRILRLEDEQPVLEANPELTRPISHCPHPSSSPPAWRTQAIITSWRAARQTLPAASPTSPRPCSHDRALVADGRDLPNLPTLLSGHERRRHRRPQGDRTAARLLGRPWRRRDLDLAHLPLADGRFRI